MNKFDPYRELGVEKDATTAEIRAAAKNAAKNLHPDCGGDKDKFIASRRALALLTDIDRRAKFDRTGETEDEPAENKSVRAMQVIFSMLTSLTNEFLTSGFDPAKDPRKINLIAAVSEYLRGQIKDGKKALKIGKRHEEFLTDFVSRFSSKKKTAGKFSGDAVDVVKRQIEDEIRNVRRRQEQVEGDLEVAQLALDMLGSIEFRFDQPFPTCSPTSFFNITGV